MKIVLVGESWGRHEAEFKHPLVGPSGRELSLELGNSGLAPYMTMSCRKCKRETEFRNSRCTFCQEYIWPNEFTLLDHWKKLRQDHGIAVTNVFQVQPPGNDLGHFFGTVPETKMPAWKASRKSGGSHIMTEHFPHVQRLWDEIADLDPNLVVCLGNAACWALLGQTKITALRGTVNKSDVDLTGINVKCLPTFHPAAVLRQPPMRVSVVADLTKATREAEFPEIRRPKRFITIPAPNEHGLEEIRAWLFSTKGEKYSIDIETIRGQISIIGFANRRDNALVIPFRDANQNKSKRIVDVGKIATSIGFPEGGINFWPTPELEFTAWKLAISGIESSSEKIFQNGVYDMSYFIRMGIHPKNSRHDTMLWHHAEFIELPKSLGYLGSIYANDIAWKQMSRHDSLKRDE